MTCFESTDNLGHILFFFLILRTFWTQATNVALRALSCTNDFFSKVLYDGFQSRGLQKYQTRSQTLPIFCPHYLRILVTFRNFAIYARIMVKAEHCYHITKRHHTRTVTDGFRGSTHIKHVPRCGNFVNYL